MKLSRVMGVPYPTQVEVPKGSVPLNPDYAASEALERELIEDCSSRLIPHSYSRGIEFPSDMPMTKVGKVSYRKLEARERGCHAS